MERKYLKMLLCLLAIILLPLPALADSGAEALRGNKTARN